MQNTRKKQILTISSIAVLSAVLATVGVVLAIMSQTVESRANQFSFSNADIDLQEPGWDPEEEKIVYPGAVFTKDPYVENTGANPLYVYLEVKTPIADVSIVDENEQIIKEENYALLNYEINDPWTELIGYTDAENHCLVRVYGCLDPVPAHDQSVTLFDEVEFDKNILEGQPEIGLTISMPVTAYAIQEKYLSLPDDNSLSPEEKLKTALTEAFTTYLQVQNHQQ